MSGSGEESFAEVVPHPDTAGVYGGDATIDDYLVAQGAAPYMAAADRYLALFRRMLAVLARREDLDEACHDARHSREAGAATDAGLLDVDAVVDRWCHAHGLERPADVEARIALHIEAIDAEVVAGGSTPR